MSKSVTTPFVEVDCPYCNGSGAEIEHICCGDFHETGECKGYCVVPSLQPCDTCGGGGKILIQDKEIQE